MDKVVASGGPVVPGPPFEIGAPPFHVRPTVCCIDPKLYFKNVAPLLQNPGDGRDLKTIKNWVFPQAFVESVD